jgi:hypothetical protein
MVIVVSGNAWMRRTRIISCDILFRTQMVGMRLARTGRTWSFICRTLRGVLVCLLTALLKMLHFILRLPASWPGLVLSLRNVRSCGCLKMTFGTRPHGHRPRLCFLSQVNIGAGPRPSSQDDGVPQHQETATLMFPQINRLIEASFVWDESSASNVDATAVPSQHRVTQQILSHWQPFQDLKLMFAK